VNTSLVANATLLAFVRTSQSQEINLNMKGYDLKMNKEIIKGLYIIENILNENVYVGISTDIYRRWDQHKKDLVNNTHHQPTLQYEFNKLKDKYKDDIFKQYKFIILKECEVFNWDDMKLLEDEYILKFRDEKQGYKQRTNYELYIEDRKGNINIDYLFKHKELHDNYYNMRRERTKQRVEENNKIHFLKIEYENDYLYSEWINDLRFIPTLAYFYNNNKDLIKQEFNNITLKEIQDYTYYNVALSSIKDVLQFLYKNNLLKFKDDIKTHKLKKNDVFSIELIKNDKLIQLIRFSFMLGATKYILNDKEYNY